MKITTKDIISKKSKGEKIVVLTAYDAIFAKLADEAGADMILVGDSVGNTFLGFSSTVNVSASMMLHHTAAVARANPNALIVADIPFAVAALDVNELIKISAKFLQEAGAQAVKIEGGIDMAQKISALTKAGIPVVGHIGLMPQQVLQMGGYKSFGKTDAQKISLLNDAKALEDAGAFAIVIEMTDAALSAQITESINIPTIGIGSGLNCSGQVLVCTDILGLSPSTPKFAKKYTDCSKIIKDAFLSFAEDVKASKFPQS